MTDLEKALKIAGSEYRLPRAVDTMRLIHWLEKKCERFKCDRAADAKRVFTWHVTGLPDNRGWFRTAEYPTLLEALTAAVLEVGEE